MGAPAKFPALPHFNYGAHGGCRSVASPLRQGASRKRRSRDARRAVRDCATGRRISRLHPPSRGTGRSALRWIQADETPPQVPDLPLALTPSLWFKQRPDFPAFRSVRQLRPISPSNLPGAGMMPPRPRRWRVSRDFPPFQSATDRLQRVFPSTPTTTRSRNFLRPARPKHLNWQTVPTQGLFLIRTAGRRSPALLPRISPAGLLLILCLNRCRNAVCA